jgi:hypothetical protein
MKKLLFLGLLLVHTSNYFGQSFYFGPKVGPSLNFQFWNDTENDPLLGLNGDIFIESAEEDISSSFYASIGYRTRGSAWRTGQIGTQFNFNSLKFRFNNAVLEVGAKKMLSTDKEINPYYAVGLRGEYNISTNLKQYENELYFPQESFVRKIVYGPSFSGGFEFNFRELSKFAIELNLSSDLNSQYYQPPIANIRDPFTGIQTTLQERNIRNYSFEVKFLFKFLRKVIYE